MTKRHRPGWVESLLALRPDCVSYNGLWANPDDFCRILERGTHDTLMAARGMYYDMVTRQKLEAEYEQRT